MWLLFSRFAQFLVTIRNSQYARGSCSLQRVIKDTQDLSSHCVTNHWGWTGVKRRKLPISLRWPQLSQHDSTENPFSGPSSPALAAGALLCAGTAVALSPAVAVNKPKPAVTPPRQSSWLHLSPAPPPPPTSICIGCRELDEARCCQCIPL